MSASTSTIPKKGGWVRSTVRALLFLVAFGVPVAGTLTVRAGLPGLPEALWVLALTPVLAVAISRGILRALIVVLLGGGLLAATNYAGLTAGLVVQPMFPWPQLLLGWSTAALAFAGLGAAWGSSRRRANRLLTLTDPVTGLPNRRYADLFLVHEFAVAELGRPLAALLLDIDHFSSYTASSGEAAGQALLRAIGGILRQNTRSANLSAHWANDRFVCLLVGATQEGALKYARRLQEQLRASGGVATIPSVSIGVAGYAPEMRAPSDLLRAAESALEQAKRDGGDRIRFFGRSADETEPAEGGGNARESRISADHPDAAHDSITGAPRTAFVFGGDPAIRRRAAEQLERRGIRVTEVSRPVEGMRALAAEFDLVAVDLAHEDPGVADLVREVRRRYPAARILGVPGYEGNAINPAALTVRVDGHLLRTNGSWTFQPPLEDLLRERDRLRENALRALQLSDEVRVKEREAQRARAENEARIRSLVQSIREVLFRMDRSGAWISLSPAWSTLTGQTVEQSLGRPWLEFFHEDDRDALAREFDALTSSERPSLRREARIKTRSGGTRWVEVRAQLAHDRLGNVLSASGTLADITDRRRVEEALHRSEEYFRALIENAADLIAVMDGDGRIRYVSPSAERMLGHHPEDGVLLGALEELVHPEDVSVLKAALRTAEAPGASASFEARFRHADASWRHLAVSVRNLTHISAVRGWVVNAHDVTAHHEAERALRESEEALYRARKMDAIGMLAGGIAHDFNNLLTSIQGHIDIAIGALAPDHPIRSDLMRIQDAAVRAGSLTRQLLAFGRRQVMRPRILDLNVFLSDMHKMLVRLVGEKIQLRTELGASPARVHADPMQMERAILNLAVNAREAMPHGGVLTIRTENAFFSQEEAKRADAEAGAYVAVTIADTGHGIAQEFLPHVFDPFFTTKPQAVGVGLGLSTVYGIVRQSGGYVRVDSRHANGPEAASGTTFTLFVPATREIEPQFAPEVRTAPDPGETIALVEDEPSVRELATRVLRGRGYNVIPAENGKHALDVLGRYPSRIDMLVTDVVMPEMGGRDLADRVEMMRPGVKILFMSGYSPEAVQQHGVLARGSAFLEKPFSPDSLLRKVRDVLDVMEPAEAGPVH